MLAFIGCDQGVRDGEIVFQSNRDGNFELYVMDQNGKNVRRVTNHPANDIAPMWSPDGTTIVFATDRDDNWEIYTLQLHSKEAKEEDGGQLTRLTGGGSNTSPSWTPDGRRILFVSTRDELHGEVYSMNADGSDVQRLTRHASVKESPLLTADGRYLLMALDVDGRYVIGSMRLADGEMHLLTSPRYHSVHPSVSEDGLTILFSTNRDRNFEIYTMHLDGSNPTRRTQNADDDFHPVWTSRSGEMVFSRRGSIFIGTLDGKEEHRLSMAGDRAPHWTSRRNR